MRGFSFSVAQRLAMPVFGRRQHPAVLVASARVSPEPFRSRCARSRIRAPCAARVRAGACVCTGSARGEIRGRRSSSNGGLHAGSSVERINGNAWRTAARLRLRSVVRRIRRCAVPRSNRGALDTSCLRGSIARRGLARGPGQSIAAWPSTQTSRAMRGMNATSQRASDAARLRDHATHASYGRAAPEYGDAAGMAPLGDASGAGDNAKGIPLTFKIGDDRSAMQSHWVSKKDID